MPTYEIIRSGSGWRILTHRSAMWVERSAALPTAAEAYRVLRVLQARQGLRGSDDAAPSYLVSAGHYGWRPDAEASYVAWKWTGQNLADAVAVLAEFQQYDVDFCGITVECAS